MGRGPDDPTIPPPPRRKPTPPARPSVLTERESQRPSSDPPSDKSLSKIEREKILGDLAQVDQVAQAARQEIEELTKQLGERDEDVHALQVELAAAQRTVEDLEARAKLDVVRDAERDVREAQILARLNVVEAIAKVATPIVVNAAKPQVQADAAVATKEINDLTQENQKWWNRLRWLVLIIVAVAEAWPRVKAVLDAPDKPLPPKTAPALPLPNPEHPAGIP